MLKFHAGFPYLLRCYVLVVFYLPAYLWKWEVGDQDHLSLGQAYGDLLLTSICLFSLLLPNLFFISAYSASLPILCYLINAILFYLAILSVLILEYPMATMLMGSFGSIHVLWSLSVHLRGASHRSLVMGSMVSKVCKFLCLVIPWFHYSLGPPLMLPARDIVFISMTVELLGMVFNVLNALTLGVGKTLFIQ